MSPISDMVKPSVELVDLGKPGVPGVLGIRHASPPPVNGFSHVDRDAAVLGWRAKQVQAVSLVLILSVRVLDIDGVPLGGGRDGR